MVEIGQQFFENLTLLIAYPSNELLAKTIPVRPPIVNKKTNPATHNIGVSKTSSPPIAVIIQLNILIPVGIAAVPLKMYGQVSQMLKLVGKWPMATCYF